MSRFMILRSGRYAYPDGGGELPDAGLRYHPRMSGADSGDTDAARCSMPRAAAQPPLGVGNNVSGGFRLRRSARLGSCAQRALLDRITTLGMIYASGEPTSTPVATLIYRTNHAKRRAELDEPCCSVRLMARHKAIRRRDPADARADQRRTARIRRRRRPCAECRAFEHPRRYPRG